MAETRPPSARERAIVVCLEIGRSGARDRPEEASSLVESAGADVAAVVTGRRDRPDAATFAGSGKVEEIQAAARLHEASTFAFANALTAAHIRNL